MGVLLFLAGSRLRACGTSSGPRLFSHGTPTHSPATRWRSGGSPERRASMQTRRHRQTRWRSSRRSTARSIQRTSLRDDQSSENPMLPRAPLARRARSSLSAHRAFAIQGCRHRRLGRGCYAEALDRMRSQPTLPAKYVYMLLCTMPTHAVLSSWTWTFAYF